MYALVLSYQLRPALRAVDRAHALVLGTISAALAPSVPGLHCAGTSDLVVGDRKVSGNSLRARRGHFLYHGTLLYDFPLDLVDRCLAMPPREPGYRRRRPHPDFLANLPLAAAAIVRLLRDAWGATESCDNWPQAATARLVAQRYGQPQWTEAGIGDLRFQI
jgi:lipoate-protein ligase A